MRRFLLTMAMAGLLPAGAAFAQQSPSGAGAEPPPAPEATPAPETNLAPPPESMPPAYEPVAAPPAHKKARIAGPSMRAEAGLMAFPGAAHDIVNPGLSYGAGIGFEGPQLVGLEVNYQGAAYGTKTGYGLQESIAENGGEALLKLGPKTRMLDVYALGGYGLSFINVAERQAVSPVQDDWVSKLPVGLGLDVKVPTGTNADVTFGARSSYDFVFNNDAFRGEGGLNDANSSSRSSDQINTQLTLGGKF